jgi:ATP-dependent 26S proteasome regulatory subunit
MRAGHIAPAKMAGANKAGARNMDPAFARRLHYVVEFPRPDAAARERLWAQMLAPPLPRAADMDLPHLARSFDLTSGEIRKTALDAAFMAVADGRVVRMAHLTAGAARELQTQARVVAPALAARA